MFNFIRLAFITRVALYISGFGNPSVAICQLPGSIVKLDIFEVIRTQNVLTYASAIFVVYSNLKDLFRPKKMELNRESTVSASMNLIQFLAMKLHQGPVFIDGIW